MLALSLVLERPGQQEWPVLTRVPPALPQDPFTDPAALSGRYLPPWSARARCASDGRRLRLFFPETDGLTPERQAEVCRPALRICADCPVRRDCLEHSLSTGDVYGVFGGTTPAERWRARHEGLEPDDVMPWLAGHLGRGRR